MKTLDVREYRQPDRQGMLLLFDELWQVVVLRREKGQAAKEKRSSNRINEIDYRQVANLMAISKSKLYALRKGNGQCCLSYSEFLFARTLLMELPTEKRRVFFDAHGGYKVNKV